MGSVDVVPRPSVMHPVPVLAHKTPGRRLPDPTGNVSTEPNSRAPKKKEEGSESVEAHEML